MGNRCETCQRTHIIFVSLLKSCFASIFQIQKIFGGYSALTYFLGSRIPRVTVEGAVLNPIFTMGKRPNAACWFIADLKFIGALKRTVDIKVELFAQNST
jgi:hypothetical protein